MKAVSRSRREQAGALMIEILVTLTLVTTGLWAVAHLHTRLLVSEMESFQRTRALNLLEDMADRLKTNPAAAEAYLTDEKDGIGATDCPSLSVGSTRAVRDLNAWCLALRGSAVRASTGAVAELPLARGCVQALADGVDTVYRLTVVWQGARPLSRPPGRLPCGEGGYDSPPGSDCAQRADMCRRYVSTQVQLTRMQES